MTQQFTASEVRAYTHKVGDGIPMLSDMLRAFADMLEAREKAVPFGYAYRYWDGIRFDTGGREINGSKPTATIPLYTHTPTHPAPSDADRLAEALHSIGERLSSVLCDPFGEVVVRGSDDDRQIIAQALKDLGELAAHSAQAHPPAASVPDIETMVNRFLSWRLPKPWNPDNGISYTRPNYAHEPAEHDWPTGTNLFDAHQAREMIEYMLAAQENPNG